MPAPVRSASWLIVALVVLGGARAAEVPQRARAAGRSTLEGRDVLAAHHAGERGSRLRPPLALYDGLRAQLAQYRALAADPTLRAWRGSDAVVRPGDRYRPASALYARLARLGDLPAGAPPLTAPAVYEAVLVDAVRRFQARHGLQPDGIIGPRTEAALRVPPARRVRQIALALERLRHLPPIARGRVLVVNIPMFELWGLEDIDRAPSFQARVIVGRARRWQTPMLVASMRAVEFRPYWNVPASIARREILPALEDDEEYLVRHDMEIVSGPGDDARVVPPTAENLRRVRQGALRLRQRPGPANPVGLVKFVFPSDYAVALHGTPETSLFAWARRDFSHGCVRVENALALAEWVLTEQPGWTRDLLPASPEGNPVRVALARPIRVVFAYLTAVVMADGTVRFADDIYGHDARLDEALTRGAGADR